MISTTQQTSVLCFHRSILIIVHRNCFRMQYIQDPIERRSVQIGSSFQVWHSQRRSLFGNHFGSSGSDGLYQSDEQEDVASCGDWWRQRAVAGDDVDVRAFRPTQCSSAPTVVLCHARRRMPCDRAALASCRSR